MTIEDAYSRATDFVNMLNEKQFLQDFPPDATPFLWSYGEMTEFPSCYYFDWKLLHLDGRVFDEPAVAGPPGFTVSKLDGSAEIVSHGSLYELHLEEKRKDELLTLLMNVKEGKGDLFKIKNIYNLSSKEILLFSKALQRETFDRDSVTEKLHQVLKKIKP